MPRTEAIQQKRRTDLAGNSYVAEGLPTDIYQEITISNNNEGYTAEVSLWNISRPDWNGVETGDSIRIGLGYHPNPFGTVFYGTVEEKHTPESDGSDTRYSLSASDKSERIMKSAQWSKTWVSPSVGQVVRDIAAHADVGIGRVINPGGPIEPRYAISREQPLSYWLDELVEHANEFSARQYDWWCSSESGGLFFAPKDYQRTDAVLARDGRRGNIITLDPSEGTTEKTNGSDDMDFEGLLDPRIQKGGAVKVQAETHPGTYQVRDYTLTSSTEDGSHEMSATLAPADAKYRAVGRGGSARRQTASGTLTT